ncbi:hypothetical protein LCGC14_2595230 [marine sediment metagenome]|uniref:Uncharacterized protein n=1 Tax=marine sediment metagenome TaxID=412755 RepID=A0A0F9AAP6_9ZZZZ
MDTQTQVQTARRMLMAKGYATHATFANAGATRLHCSARTAGKACGHMATHSVRDRGGDATSDRYVCTTHLLRAAARSAGTCSWCDRDATVRTEDTGGWVDYACPVHWPREVAYWRASKEEWRADPCDPCANSLPLPPLCESATCAPRGSQRETATVVAVVATNAPHGLPKVWPCVLCEDCHGRWEEGGVRFVRSAYLAL